MLFVRSLFGGAIFPDNETVVVYEKSNDKYNNSDYDIDDIVFESSSLKVVFPKVYNAYEWSVEILDYIQKHIDNDVIIIDLNKLIHRDGEYLEFECGHVYVESNVD